MALYAVANILEATVQLPQDQSRHPNRRAVALQMRKVHRLLYRERHLVELTFPLHENVLRYAGNLGRHVEIAVWLGVTVLLGD
jgi:hypothetical protein